MAGPRRRPQEDARGPARPADPPSYVGGMVSPRASACLRAFSLSSAMEEFLEEILSAAARADRASGYVGCG